MRVRIGGERDTVEGRERRRGKRRESVSRERERREEVDEGRT